VEYHKNDINNSAPVTKYILPKNRAICISCVTYKSVETAFVFQEINSENSRCPTCSSM
jgi:hypothetical protein